MSEEIENIEETSTQEIKYTVVGNDDIKSENNTVNNDDTEYTELNEDLAYQYLADQKGVSLEDYKNHLNNKSFNDEYVELDEDYAVSFIAEKKGMTVDEFKESLTPKQQKQYAPEITAFAEFYEKTGNKNYNDFLETQKDWSTETPENTLREYIRLSNPDLTKKEQDYLYNEKYSIDDLDEEDDENLILKKGIDTKTDLRKAGEFFSKRKEEFNVVSGTDEHIPIEYREAKKLIDNQAQQDEDAKKNWQIGRDKYVEFTNSRFNENFEGFKVKLGNETIGFNEVAFKPENIQEIKEFVSDTNNLMRDFHDENGNLVKPAELHDALYFAKNREKLMNQAYNRGYADKVEADDKLSKNIQPDNIRQVNSIEGNKMTFRVVEP